MLLSGGALSPGGLLSGIKLWTPIDEPLTRLWLDGADSSTQSESPASWTSKATRGDVFTGAAGSLVKGNGFATVDNMDCPSTFGLLGDPDFTLMAVATRSPGHIVISMEQSGGRFVNWQHNGAESALRYGNGNYIFPSVASDAKLLCSISDASTVPSNVFNRVSGTNVALVSAAPPSTAADLNDLSSNLGVSVFNIYDLFVFESVSIALIEKFEGYAAHKHGLAGSLPSSHPYKAAPPIA